MEPGTVIADRFEIDRPAGTGGMGTVYRAIDVRTGQPVAVKCVRQPVVAAAERFLREARILAELTHPGIVRYVDHGEASSGELYLAMEWLEGEGLIARLGRQALTLSESLTIGRRVAEALGEIHDRGVVHRDVKPSNIFLVDSSVEKVKLLDFGIARHSATIHPLLTHSGAVLGTPSYMSPEQARGDREVDARADVFALGCVLFECITGRPPFEGEHVMAVLTRVLLEEVRLLGEVLQGIPPKLEQLVAAMLSKAAERRPRNGTAVARALADVGEIDGSGPATQSVAPQSLTRTEKRLFSVLFFALPSNSLDADRDSAPTTDGKRVPKAVLDVARAHGARIEVLAGGAAVLTLVGTGAATDQAAHAAHCALALRALLLEAPIALTTGRGLVAGRWPVGEVVDRATRLLRVTLTGSEVAYIRLDDVTAGLLDTRFDIGGDRSGLFLRGKRPATSTARALRGKPTPCVGRDREIGLLAGLFDECAGEPAARAALITAPAGFGKSRVRHELFARLRAAHTPVQVWMGRGDPMSAGSPFGVIAAALRSEIGIADGESPRIRCQKLRARVARHVSDVALTRVSCFLGDMIGVPFPEQDSIELQAARRDAMLLSDQMLNAWLHFLSAESRSQPILLVLEDLHWGDLPSVRFIDAALRVLSDRPIMVLALARPDVDSVFPDLWSGRPVTRIELPALSRRASTRLAHEVLGDSADEATIALLVDRAVGNAFYMEELIRSVAEGRGHELPATVLAMSQARIEALPEQSRRALRAAAVFGSVFWAGGVAALLGSEQQAQNIASQLRCLSDEEVISPREVSQFPQDREYVFRHDLVREAAYAMLTDEDRMLGHRLAGEWLERAGEVDPVVVATHLEIGGLKEQACEHWARAAERALEASDLMGAIERSERAAACGATGHRLGRLRLVQAEAHYWRAEYADAARASSDTLDLVPLVGEHWYSAARLKAMANGRLGRTDGVEEIAKLLQDVGPTGSNRARQLALANVAWSLSFGGCCGQADVLIECLRAEAGSTPEDPVVAAVFLGGVLADRAMGGGDDVEAAELRERAIGLFERAGDQRRASNARANAGYAKLRLGLNSEAERLLGEALAQAERLGLEGVVAGARQNLGLALLQSGKLDEAKETLSLTVASLHGRGSHRLEGAARIYYASTLLQQADARGAEREARAAVELLEIAPPLLSYAHATLARVLLTAGRTAEARECAAKAFEGLAAGGTEEGEATIRLAWAEALEASGDYEGAKAVIAEAHDRLHARASRIASAEIRSCFLGAIPEHVRTLALAREWLG